MLSKKDPGYWRPCGDYRALNSQTVPGRYSLPHIQGITANLAESAIFSKIYLIGAHYQICLAAEDNAGTAVITPFGPFKCLRMPFGLRNAPQTFERFVNDVTR